MKVLLIGNLLEDRQESMQRFTALLQAGLLARGHEVTLLAPTLRLARLGPLYRYAGLPKYLGYVDKFVLFPRELRRQIRRARPDVVHFTDHANAVYVSATDGVPALATCHDLLQIRAARGEMPGQAVGWLGRRYQAWIAASLARLPAIACVSARTREEVLRLLGQPAPHLALIPNALNYPYQPISAEAARRQLSTLRSQRRLDTTMLDPLRGGFLLHVGGGQWYKNREGVITIFAELRRRLTSALQLLMVGPPLTTAQKALAEQLGVAEDIVVCTGVTNPELEALYNLAEGLLFPSWEEGFGWPIAEAQSCGCAVFASNRAPMTEVGGTGSVYFDPADPAGAAGTIAAAWPWRTLQRPAALLAARRWQPALMLDAYEALYRQLLP